MSANFEVDKPIQNSPFAEPTKYWYIREGEAAELRDGRRRAVIFPPHDQKTEWDLSDGTLVRSEEYPVGYEMVLVNLARERVEAWREQDYPGVTRTSYELLKYWQRDGRETGKRLFFAQLEAAETIIFLKEARADFLQGIQVPREEVGEDRRAEGYEGFERYACKMATGCGKTTVMGMLAAWSILNKVNDRSDGRFSDVVLIVCPNVTIRERLAELLPERGEASLYRTRDLVPPHFMSALNQGRVLVKNWHEFNPREPGVGGQGARVIRAGKPDVRTVTIKIAQKTTTMRRTRYMTPERLEQMKAAGIVEVVPGSEKRDKAGNLTSVKARVIRHIESDTALVNRVLGREVGGKQNVLVMNDEAHHAYRIKPQEKSEEEEDLFGEKKEADEFFQEATVWVDGLDKIDRLRGVNFCVDFSATPFYLGRVGQQTNRPFQWTVSDFDLIEAIESGMVKVPQLPIRDASGEEHPHYFNIWRWILTKLTPAERGGKKGNPKPDAVLKYAHPPVALLGGRWEKLRTDWTKNHVDERPPVFIIVCKNTKIAAAMYDWLAEGKTPRGVPTAGLDGLRNRNGEVNTIRVDSKVVHETDTEGAKSDEFRWMRSTLDTVGKGEWPVDAQGRPQYPPGFEELAAKLERPLHPPGRDIRCLVSVGMLTEGWDCSTVTHIIGLRPFMSQLLCEQVVGRGLRRTSYESDDDGMFTEEIAEVLGVPFEVIPFKADPTAKPKTPRKRHHVHAVPGKAEFKITFPRVEGYTQAIRNRITVDWDSVPPLPLEPDKIPPEVEAKALSVNNEGKLSLSGPGKVTDLTLEEWRQSHRLQELVFQLGRAMTRDYCEGSSCEAPAHVLFPQIVKIADRYVREKVNVIPPSHTKDLFLSPYYGWLVERLVQAIQPDASRGEIPELPKYETRRGPGSTSEVSFTTSKEVREARRCHLNYVVADTKRWEQSAAYYIDKHERVAAFVKNQGLGFAIPYLHNGQMHDYVPDYLVLLKTEEPRRLILEIKGYDPLAEVKAAAAERWVAAVNADGRHGEWRYAVARRPGDVPGIIAGVA